MPAIEFNVPPGQTGGHRRALPAPGKALRAYTRGMLSWLALRPQAPVANDSGVNSVGVGRRVADEPLDVPSVLGHTIVTWHPKLARVGPMSGEGAAQVCVPTWGGARASHGRRQVETIVPAI